MKIQWTSKASSDLVRLHEHLSPVAPEAAARVVHQLAHAPDRLLDYPRIGRSEEHTSELQSLMRISYAVFCLKKKRCSLLLVHTSSGWYAYWRVNSLACS